MRQNTLPATKQTRRDSDLDQVQIIVLARGKGERLRPLTLTRPKAFCPVCNIPMLSRLLLDLRASGFRSATLSLPNPLGADWDNVKRRFPRNFAVAPVIAERPARGSIDAVRQCLDDTTRPVMVIYGDSFLKADLATLVRSHFRWNREQSAAATVLYHLPADRHTPDAKGRTYHGVFGCREDGRVTRFIEKPRVTSVRPGFEYANAAVFVLQRSVFEDSRFTNAADFSRDFFEPAVNRDWLPVYAVPIGERGFRHDLGNPERLFEANMKVLRGDWQAPLPGREVRPKVWCESGVQVKGARVVAPVVLGRRVKLERGCTVGPRVVIGDDCTIGAGAVIRDSVLLQSTKVEPDAKIERSIIGAFSKIARRLPPGCCVGDFSSFSDTLYRNEG